MPKARLNACHRIARAGLIATAFVPGIALAELPAESGETASV